jgi:hypothetical protein
MEFTPVREYDIFVPLLYNDGTPVEAKVFQTLQSWLLKEFDGLTFFPQPNKGTWKMGSVVFHDEIVIYRVLTDRSKKTHRFFKKLKEKLKTAFRQEDILIVVRNVGVV